MADFTLRQTLWSDDFDHAAGIRHIGIVESETGPVLHTATLSGGGVSWFAVLATGGLRFLDATDYPGALRAGVAPVLALAGDGTDRVLLVSGIAPAGPALDTAGAAGAWTALPGYSAVLVGATGIVAGARSFILAGTEPGSVVTLETDGAGGLVQRGALAGIGATAFAQTGDGRVFAVSPRDDAITLLEVGSDGSLAAGPSVSAADGLGLNHPDLLAAVSVGGEHFVVVGSPGSSALTVLTIRDGTFAVTDHVIDDLGTRFQAVGALHAVTANGRAFVAAGGGDDGVTLFELVPGGRLVHLQTIVDATSTTLANVAALALVDAEATLQLVVAGESDPGLSVFARSLSSLGAPRIGTNMSDILSGGATDDLVAGQAGDDTLSGGAGDDIMSDGAGVDRMTGGSGADVFVLSADGALDRITDFEVGIDRLDLSAWTGLYAVSGLSVTARPDGARLVYGTETLEIVTSDRLPMNAGDLTLAGILGVTRPPLVPIGRDIEGDAGADTLDGAFGADRLSGLEGDDRLEGFEGGDLVLGGGGADDLRGGDGADRIDGGEGGDTAAGGSGGDFVTGGAGNDVLRGDDGADLLVGGVGDDLLDGGAGHDILRGGAGADTLDGGSGNDQALGGAGSDRIDGGHGDDLLWGGAGADAFVFRTGYGRDTISDFDPAEAGEVIVLGLTGPRPDWGDVAALLVDGATGVEIDFGGGDVLVLEGLAAAALGADDFFL